MKVGKPHSKRVPVRRRHKIEKASAAKQRKQRKLAKKDPTWRTKLKKDPGIPNLFPYKDRILKEVEENRRRREEEASRKKELEQAQNGLTSPSDSRDKDDHDSPMGDDSDALLDLEDDDDDDEHDSGGDLVMHESKGNTNPMAALVASARARASEFDRAHNEKQEDGESGSDTSSIRELSTLPSDSAKQRDSSQKPHATTIHNLISNSDILLYVLDARDPVSTRSPKIEQAVLSDPSKRLIFVLNKIDLVPKPVLQSWLVQLRRSFPTLPLRAGSSAPNAKIFDHKTLTQSSTAAALFKALKSYSARHSTSRSLSVGVLGYPNVGKSSVINALTSQLGGRAAKHRGRDGRECPVGADAGVTTAIREVKLDGSIKLIDSPGVVFPSTASKTDSSDTKKKTSKEQEIENHARLVLLNAIPPRAVDDPIPAVSLLLRRLSKDQTGQRLQSLMDAYNIPPIVSDHVNGDKDITTDFLVQVARKRGRLSKGGIPNLRAAAQSVIADWRDGRIQGWVEVTDDVDDTYDKQQDVEAGGVSLGGRNQQIVVQEWAEEFKIDGLWGNGDDDAETRS